VDVGFDSHSLFGIKATDFEVIAHDAHRSDVRLRSQFSRASHVLMNVVPKKEIVLDFNLF
jgi:hypothetical protein